MELVKDIYFNTDKLVENTKVKVSYTGKFYQGNNEHVFLHYGYGKNWNNVNDIEMNKTDLGYQAEINLASDETINFCFKNQNNEWDNNLGNNYIFAIEKANPTTGNNVDDNKNFFSKIFEIKEENASGVIEDVVNHVPNGFDATFVNTPTPVNNNIGLGGTQLKSKLETPVDNNCFKVITPSTSNANVVFNNGIGTVTNKTTNTGITNFVSNTNNTPNVASPINRNTSIAIAPTGFNYWTQKIKASVSKLFSYVPKFISGNYKRNITNNNLENK